jgi:hypothetical protein
MQRGGSLTWRNFDASAGKATYADMVLEEVRKEQAGIKPPLEPEGASRMQVPWKVPEIVSSYGSEVKALSSSL